MPKFRLEINYASEIAINEHYFSKDCNFQTFIRLP